MPSRIIPPGCSPVSLISTSWPSRDRGRVERPAPLEREIAEEPLDRVNGDGAVEAGAVADALARVVADPAVDRRHRVVGGQLPPRAFMVTGLGVRQPRLDVFPGR